MNKMNADIQPSIMETIWAQEQEKKAKEGQSEMEWEVSTQPVPRQSFISSKVGHILSEIRKRRVSTMPGTTTVKIVRRTSSKTTPPRNIKHSKPHKGLTSESAISPTTQQAPSSIRSEGTSDYKSSLFAVLPHIMSGYLQLLLNILIISAIIFLLFKFWVVLQHDIDLRAELYAIDIDQENRLCAKEYKNNKCDDRVPALEEKCSDWDNYPLNDTT